MNKWFQKSSGFTIVELLVVIVVIGILAGITTVAYGGFQRRAGETVVKNDLGLAALVMDKMYTDEGIYPVILPPTVKTSADVSLSLVGEEGVPQYPALSPVQSGVLFQHLCQSLIAEGFGTGTNMGGGVEQYITACNVYGHGSIQINGWNAHNFNVPITSSTLSSYAASIPPGDAWRPNQQAVRQAFYLELAQRFTTVGGVYPVNSFWDPWATPSNGGVLVETLPPPVAPGPDGSTYCIQAAHVKYTDLRFFLRPGGTVTAGDC